MHILFTRFPYESAHGGAEIQTLVHMKELKKRGHTVEFLGSCPVLLGMCRENDIPATELHIGLPPVTQTGAMSFAWRQFGMKRKLQQAFDAIHSREPIDAVCMLSLSEKLLLTPHDSRIIWIEHDAVGRWLIKNPWLNRLKKLSINVTTVTVSELSRQLYIKMGWPTGQVVAIPNGIEIERLAKGSNATHQESQSDSLKLGCVARLTADKGVDILIDAVTTLEDIQLSIVGRGKGEEPIAKQIRDLSLESRVDLISDAMDIPTFYQQIDVLVLPSRINDPFGLVAAEAMLLNTPVIVTDACGIAGYLKHNHNALIVPAGSVSALTDAIERMHDITLRTTLARNALETAQKKFSVPGMMDALEDVLQNTNY